MHGSQAVATVQPLRDNFKQTEKSGARRNHIFEEIIVKTSNVLKIYSRSSTISKKKMGNYKRYI